jgi:histidinol phosphatase-like enzyme
MMMKRIARILENYNKKTIQNIEATKRSNTTKYDYRMILFYNYSGLNDVYFKKEDFFIINQSILRAL